MKHSPGFLKIVEDAKSRVREITVAETRQKQEAGEAFHFVDVREDHEWQKGRATGSTHLGKGIIERDIETLIPDRQAGIVLYCGGGYRSVLTAKAAAKMGYQNVFSIKGGYKAMVEAGWPMKPGS